MEIFTHDEKAKIAELKDDERQPCEVWTRVMGYFRSTNDFNVGKKSEYAERVCFSEKKAAAHVADMAAE